MHVHTHRQSGSEDSRVDGHDEHHESLTGHRDLGLDADSLLGLHVVTAGEIG